jgi:hypothetical protein
MDGDERELTGSGCFKELMAKDFIVRDLAEVSIASLVSSNPSSPM